MSDFLPGSFGGACGILLSHPLDTIRIRYQCLKPNENIYFGKLYKGIIPPLLGMMLEKSIVFGVYNLLKEQTNSNIIAGLGAGASSACIITPIEKIKIGLQQNFKLTQSLQLKQSYKGFIPTLCRESIGFALYFSIYNYLKQKYNTEHNYIKTLFIGGSSGVGSWIFIYPIDVVKTRLQSPTLQYKNIRHCIRDTSKIYGYSFFYRGLTLGLLRAFQLHAGVWIGYELCRDILDNKN